MVSLVGRWSGVLSREWSGVLSREGSGVLSREVEWCP